MACFVATGLAWAASSCSGGDAGGDAAPDSSATAVSGTATASDLPEFHAGEAASTESTAGSTAGSATAAPQELTWTRHDQREVAGLARTVMNRFARPTGVAERRGWWMALAPYLSAQAQQDYSGTDPANVPVTAVTGRVVLVPLETEEVSIAHVPTDAGLYAVTLSRSAEQPQWVVERITPPEPNQH